MTSRSEEIRQSYKMLGGSFANFYDGMITYATPAGKLVNRLIWDFDGPTTEEWIASSLAGIPDGFAGRLLEVPVGTGVLTVPTYRHLPSADITCLDYSQEMMGNAERRARAMGIDNITFCQGDVGKLPFADESFDIVLSLNGFHAFPNKEAAYRETFRVLKEGGTFCGCFYVRAEVAKTDWFVEHLFVPKGAFTPPFESRESLAERLSFLYRKVQVKTVKAEGVFLCQK